MKKMKDSFCLSKIPVAIGIKILVCCLVMTTFSKHACAQASNVVDSVTWTNGIHTDSIAGQITSPDTSIYSDTISDSAKVDFISGTDIILKPGFDAGGFSDSGHFDARINPCNLLQVSVTSVSVNCNGISSGSAMVHAISSSPFSYIWSSGGTDSIATELTEGTYTVTVTDVNNCSATLTATIQASTLTASVINVTGTGCIGSSDGSAAVAVSGGVPPYSYSWSPSGQTTASATGLEAGYYTATVSDSNGCSVSVTINIPLTLHNSINTAIPLEPYNLYADYETGDTVLWLTFTAQTSALTMNIAKPLNSADTMIALWQTAGLYTTSDSLLGEWNAEAADSGVMVINVNFSPLVIDSSYYIMLSRPSSECGVFSVMTDFVVRQSNSCGGPCNLVGDGEFEQYIVSCGDSDNINPFTSCVPCWSCSHGTPQIGDSAGYYYALMWAANTNYGEGIQTTLFDSLVIGNPELMYVFQMRYKVDSQSVANTPFNIQADLTTISYAQSAMPPFGCSDDASGMPPGPKYTHHIVTVPNSNNWTDSYTCIASSGLDSSDADLKVLWIYPTTGDSLVWVDVDSINMYVINASLGDTETCICDTTVLKPVRCAPPGYLNVTYLWSTGATTDSIIITPVSSQTIYSLTMTYGSCSVSSQIKIDPPCTPLFTILPNAKQICSNNKKITLYTDTAGPGFQWLWNTGATTDSVTFAAVPNTNDTAIVTVTDYGCKGTDTLVFHWLPQLAIQLSSPASHCDSNKLTETVIITDSTNGPYTYLWLPDSLTSATVTLSPGIYTVYVNDSNQCTAIQTDTVGFIISLQTTGFADCSNKGSMDVTITGGSQNLSAYSYSWTPSVSVTSSANDLAAGIYTVTVTDDSTGCTATASRMLINNFYVDTSSIYTKCNGYSTGVAIVKIAGEASSFPFTYTWKTSTGSTISSVTDSASTSEITNLANGTYTVIINSGTCTDTATVTVYDSIPVTITVKPPSPTICSGTAVTLTASGASSYTWSPSGSLSADTGASVSATPPGNITYTVTGTTDIGCIGTATVKVDTADALPFSYNIYGGCTDSDGRATVRVSFPDSGHVYTYVWVSAVPPYNTVNSVTTIVDSSLVYNLAAGNYYITVTDTTIHCSGTQKVTVPYAIVLTLATRGLCSGGIATITLKYPGTDTYYFSWVDSVSGHVIYSRKDTVKADSLTIILIDTDLLPGSYYAFVTDSNTGCFAVSNVGTLGNDFPPLDTSNTLSSPGVCPGGTETITAHVPSYYGIISYAWSPSDNLSDTLSTSAILTVQPDSTTSYTLMTRRTTGCIDSSKVTVIVYPLPTVTVSPYNTTICAGNSITLIASGAEFYAWYMIPGSGVSFATGDTITVTPTSTTIYQVTGSNANGCSNFSFDTITVDPAITDSLSSDSITCYGGSNGSATAHARGGTAPYAYSWSPGGGTDSTATGLSAGIYIVTVTDSIGCNKTDSILINQPDSLILTITTTSGCSNDSNGTAMVTVTGGTPGYNYLWNTGAITDSIGGLSTGLYIVTVTDSNGCIAAATDSVILNSPPDITVSPSDTTICGGGNVTLTAGGAVNYTWSPSSGLSSTTGDTVTATLTTTTTYIVTGIDSNACSDTASVTITVDPPLTDSLFSVSVSCYGGSNGSATVNVSGGMPPYTYVWSNGEATNTDTNLIAGIYTITVTDSIGCTVMDSITISQPDSLILTITTTSGCSNDSNGTAMVTVTGGTPGYNYFWNTGAITDSIGGLSTGLYIVTVTDSNGCIAAATDSVILNSPPDITVSPSDTTICGGGNVTLIAGGAVNYTWSPSSGLSSTTGDTVTATLTTTTTYIVTGIDSNACSDTASVTITVDPPLTDSLFSVSVSCYGGSNGSATVNVSGGMPPYTYVWSNGEATNTDTNLIAGIYTITVTDSIGCTVMDSITISQPDSLILTITATSGCSNDSNGTAMVTVTGGTPGYNYFWNTGAITDSIGGLSTGLYIVTVTDSNGCIAAATDSVILNSPPAITVSPSDTTICGGGNVTLIAGGAINYTWSPSTGLSSTTGDTVTATLTTTTTYIVTGIDSNACSDTASVTITVDPPLTDSLFSVSVSCYGGSNGSATVNVSGGMPPYTYVWSNGEATNTDTNLIAGIYTITVTDSVGCTVTDSITISQPDSMILTITATSGCSNDSNGTAMVTVTGGTPGYNYFWNTGAITDSIGGLSTGLYIVTVTDSNGCIAAATDSVLLNSPPAITVSPSDKIICRGGIITLIAGGAVNYTWSPSTGLSSATGDTVTATLTSTTTYIVMGIDSNGCSDTASVTITVDPPLTDSLFSVSVSCYGGSNGSATVNVSGGMPPYTYVWSNGEATNTDTNLIAGIYAITVTDSVGCTVTDSITISQPDSLIPTITTTSGCSNGTAKVTVTGGTPGYSYFWLPDSAATDSIGGLSTGSYTVTVTDHNGCTATATDSIILIPSPTITVSPADTICPALTVTLIAGGANNYVWIGNLDTMITSSDTVTLTLTYNESTTLTTTTTYTVTGTNTTTGCSSTDTTTVTQWPIPNTPAINQAATLCGYCLGLDSSSVSGGTPPYSIQWYFVTTAISGDTSYNICGVNSGDYNVKVTDSHGCYIGGGINISVSSGDTSTMTVSPNASFCKNDAGVILSAHGAITYSWSPSAGLSDSTGATVYATPSSTTTYFVTGSDGYGCSRTLTVTVTVNSNCCVDSSGVTDISDSGYIKGGTYTGNYTLNGCVTIDTGTTVTFQGLTLLITGGVYIIVDSGATLNLRSNCNDDTTNYLYTCNDTMWVGIIVENGGTLNILDSCNFIEDAQYAVRLDSGSTFYSTGGTFRNDFVGLYVPPKPKGNSDIININHTHFTCTAHLKNGYPGQTPSPLTHSFAGIFINDLSLLTTQGADTFINLNNGIYAINSHLIVKGEYFKNIMEYDTSYSIAHTGIVPPYNPYAIYINGAGIYAAGPIRPRSLIYTGNGTGATVNPNFDSCGTAIYTNQMNALIRYAKIINLVTSGIYAEMFPTLSVLILDNDISTAATGSTWPQGGIGGYVTGGNHIEISGNLINMNNGNSNSSNGVQLSSDRAQAQKAPVINSNDIYIANSTQAAYGINSNGLNGFTLQSNYIYFSRNTPLSSSACGIYTQYSPGTTLSCNNIYGQTLANERTSGRISVASYGNLNYLYKCNTTDSTYEGFYFNALGTIENTGALQADSIKNHYNGLHIASNGQIGEQKHQGNLWVGTYGNLGAWNENTAIAKLQPIIYFPLIYHSTSHNITSPDWFQSKTDAADSTCTDVNCGH